MAHKTYRKDWAFPILPDFAFSPSGASHCFCISGPTYEERVRVPSLVWWSLTVLKLLFWEMKNEFVSLHSRFQTSSIYLLSNSWRTPDIMLIKLFKKMLCMLGTEQCQHPPSGLSMDDVLSVFDFWIVCSLGKVLSLIFCAMSLCWLFNKELTKRRYLIGLSCVEEN